MMAVGALLAGTFVESQPPQAEEAFDGELAFEAAA